jgi:hypothetical protein
MIPQTAVRVKGDSIVEPHKIDKPVEPRSEGQTSPPRQPERKRRFQIVKLEERIAPNKGGIPGKTNGGICNRTGGGGCR